MARRSVQTMQKRLREQRNRRKAQAKRDDRSERKKDKGAGFVDVDDPAAMFGFEEEVVGETTEETATEGEGTEGDATAAAAAGQ
jgi:hypothetical protein